MQNLINSRYEHKLAYIYHQIDNRGLHIDEAKLDTARVQSHDELKNICTAISKQWGFNVYVGAANKDADKSKRGAELNINSTKSLLQRLKDLKYDVPKIRKKDEETHEYEYEDSVGTLALRKLYADNRRWPDLNSGEAIRLLLEAKKLITFRNRYVNARLYRGKYYTNYNVAATTTGRRGSKKSLFGFGGNAQNFPARGKLSDIWRECITAGDGRIFIFVDQKSAEDWPVQALAENYTALEEMRNGINRHYKFASGIFGRSIYELKMARTDKLHPLHEQCEMEYYFGKKGRHANNYGMQPLRLSESLASEGYSYPLASCKDILAKVDGLDPNVKKIFHQYIRDCAYRDKKLVTPLGRERQVFGLRKNENNYTVMNELYAWIPQSTIGDNTGLAVEYLFDAYNEHDYIVQEGHDSIVQEIPENEQELKRCFNCTNLSFDRDIVFHNGISVKIPIEGKIGYNWRDTVDIKDWTEEGVLNAWTELKEKHPHENTGTRSQISVS